MIFGISVIVCCYNSAKKLPLTLAHLAKQNLGNGVKMEVIVVNNNSTDETEKVCKQEWSKTRSFIPLRVVKEELPGLNFARLKGISEANYEFVVFCDDDNWLQDNYIKNALDIMKNNPEIGVLGGRGELVANGEIPFWFYTFQEAYAVGVPALESGDVTARGYIWGAGMVIRRPPFVNFLDCDFNFFCSGRKGGRLSAGDDSEICKWFILGGFKLWYDESLVYKHFISEEKLKIEYLIGLQEGFRKSHDFLGIYDNVIKRTNMNYTLRKKLEQTLCRIGKLIWYTVLPKRTNKFVLEELQFIYPNSNFFKGNEVFFKIYQSYLKYKVKYSFV